MSAYTGGMMGGMGSGDQSGGEGGGGGGGFNPEGDHGVLGSIGMAGGDY